MLDDFLVRALLGGFGVALAAGPLGSFIVWRRMAMFGEALANAALLGIVLAVLLQLHLLLGVVLLTLLLALALTLLERQRVLPLDTLLSITAHGTLSVGLLVLSGMDAIRVDLMSLLLGDVLTISRADLGLIAGMISFVGIGLAFLWRPLLSATVHPDLAAVEGVRVDRMRLLLTLMLAVVIAVGMKIVGVLLIVSLLIVPAATARQLARTPEAMALLATLIGVMAVAGGMFLSLRLDLPAGPAMTMSAVALFMAASLMRAISIAQR